MCSGRVLVLLTSAQQLILQNGSMIDTGFHMSEFAEPVQALLAKGYEIIVATPDGKTPVPDPFTMTSLPENQQHQYRTFLSSFMPVLMPIAFSNVTEEVLGSIDGLFIPGGYGPLADLYLHPHLKKILRHMHKHQKPTAAICHGILGLCYPLVEGEQWIYEGYTMTSYPKALEQAQEASVLGASLPFYMADILTAYGAVLNDVFPDDYAEIAHDRELITGREARLTPDLTQCFIQELNAFMKHRCLT